MLEVESLAVTYGGVSAVKSVTLCVQDGELVAMLGANGAGKTSVLKAISGTVERVTGRVLFKHTDLGRMPAAMRASRLGIIHVPQGRRVFSNMTVEDNIRVGIDLRGDATGLDAAFEAFPELAGRRKQLAGTLSGGEQQMLAIARGLVARPEILLLDEPSTGLAPVVSFRIMEQIATINRTQRIAILLVEQRVVDSLEIADRGYVMDRGRVVLEGDASALLSDRRVEDAYLSGTIDD